MLTFVDHWAMAGPGDEPAAAAQGGPGWMHAHHRGHQHGTPPARADTEQAEEEAHTHAGHCHLNSASCSDVPVTSIGGFALLRESLALIGAAAVTIAMAGRLWRPVHAATVLPELPPPRPAMGLPL